MSAEGSAEGGFGGDDADGLSDRYQDTLIGNHTSERFVAPSQIPPLEWQPCADVVVGDDDGGTQILLIEDDLVDRSRFLNRLSAWGYAVNSHPSIEAALSSGPHDHDVVLVDLGPPGVHGWEGLRMMRAARPNCPVIVLTGHTEPGLAETAIDRGAHDWVWKDDPDPAALDRSIRRALRRAAFTATEEFNAMHDPLTGLANRALLDDRIATMAALAERNGSKIGVLFIDLDRFKPVNDRHGHHVGDRVLVEFARRASAVMRPSDTVARVGGDEFVVLVGNVVDDRDIDRVAHRLANALNMPYHDVEVGELQVPASIGVAAGRPDDVLPTTLLVLADRACLDAKAEPDQPIRWSAAVGLEAFIDDEVDIAVTVEYRPILDGRNIIGRDALALVSNSDGSVRTQTDYVHELRTLGRLEEVDVTLVRTALDDAERLEFGDLSVVLSPETLCDEPALVEIVSLVADAGTNLTFAVEERALVRDARVQQAATRLRAAGAKIAVADFGSGAADVLDLLQYEIDEIRLHPRFAQRCVCGDRTHVVVDVLATVCGRLGVELTVQGVASVEELHRFDAMGVRRWQGPLGDDSMSSARISIA